LTASLALSANAQEYVDLFRAHGNLAPNANYPGDDNQGNIIEAGIDLTLPIPIDDKFAIITGLAAERQSFYPDSSLNYKTEIFSANAKLGFSYRFRPSWSATFIGLPKMAGDIHGSSANDFQIGAMLLLKNIQSKKLNFSYGVYANQERFGMFLVPLLGMYYLSPRKDFEINATLPVWADIKKRVGFNVWCGASFSAMVRSYYLNDPELSNQSLYLERKSNDILFYVQFDINQTLILQTKMGYSIGRSAEVYNSNDKVDLGLSLFRFGDDRTQLNTDMLDGPMVQLKLIYRYNFK